MKLSWQTVVYWTEIKHLKRSAECGIQKNQWERVKKRNFSLIWSAYTAINKETAKKYLKVSVTWLLIVKMTKETLQPKSFLRFILSGRILLTLSNSQTYYLCKHNGHHSFTNFLLLSTIELNCLIEEHCVHDP